MIQTRDGTDLYVKDWGQGRPVVLIHGWPLNADSWDPQAVALANAGFRVIAYDRRGFGRSGQPWNGYDYDTLSDDLADVLTATGATENVSLVGFSMGGGEVARYMSRHGGKGVTTAALISSVVPYLPKTEDNPDGVPRAQLEGIVEGIETDRPKFFRTFFKSFFGEGILTSQVSDETLDWAWNIAMQASLRATIECAKSFAFTDFRPDLPAFTVPTLVLHGTSDATVPIDPTGRAAAAAIGKSQLVEYEGAPHGLFVSHGDRLTKDLLTFLGDPAMAIPPADKQSFIASPAADRLEPLL
jgi:pimeloyl-ACP methyl ester carboxylesterase